MTISTNHEWARAYARHGWAVFPLAAGTSVPALSRHRGGRGFLDATVDLTVVDQMWTMFPAANPGIATGAVSGLYVVDVDPKNGGDKSFADLLVTHGAVPVGPVVTTPSGGTHYYFRHAPGLGNTAGNRGVGIDTRGDGGYVSSPPGHRPDGDYVWMVHPRTALPVLPSWLIPVKRETTVVRNPDAVITTSADKVLAGLVKTILDAPSGTRNDKLFWAACRLAEHAAAGRLHLDEGAAALQDAASAIGLPDWEITCTVDSALRRASVAA